MSDNSNDMSDKEPKDAGDTPYELTMAASLANKMIAETTGANIVPCVICFHGKRKDIELGIRLWWSNAKVENEYNLDAGSVDKHLKHSKKLRARKFNSTEAVHAIIIERGLEALEKGEIQVKAADIVHAATRIERLQGRDIQKHEDVTPPRIVLKPFPKPGGVLAGRVIKEEEDKTTKQVGPPKIPPIDVADVEPSEETENTQYED